MDDTTPKTWPGVFNAFEQALKYLSREKKTLFIFLGIYAVLALISGIVQGDFSYMSEDYLPVEDIFYLITLLAIPTFTLAIAAGKSPSFGSLFAWNPTQYITLLVATILTSILIILAFAALIVPIIFVLPWLFLVAQIVIVENKGPIESIKASYSMMKNHKAKAWSIVGIAFLLGMITVFLLLIPIFGQVLSLFLYFWMFTVQAIMYYSLKDSKEKVAETAAPIITTANK